MLWKNEINSDAKMNQVFIEIILINFISLFADEMVLKTAN